jgi:hypothetical protein
VDNIPSFYKRSIDFERKFPRGAPLLPIFEIPGPFLFPNLLPSIIFTVLFHV